jgi:hypothetical protein
MNELWSISAAWAQNEIGCLVALYQCEAVAAQVAPPAAGNRESPMPANARGTRNLEGPRFRLQVVAPGMQIPPHSSGTNRKKISCLAPVTVVEVRREPRARGQRAETKQGNQTVPRYRESVQEQAYEWRDAFPHLIECERVVRPRES